MIKASKERKKDNRKDYISVVTILSTAQNECVSFWTLKCFYSAFKINK
jgi:hypothetical protein